MTIKTAILTFKLKKYMNNIFIDTNIIQHSIDSIDILKIHELNETFYNQTNIFLLPQIITEIEVQNIKWGWILDMITIKKLDDNKEFNSKLIDDIWKHIFYPSAFDINKYKSYLENVIYFLETTYFFSKDTNLLIESYKTILKQNFKDFNFTKEYTWSQALANLIENTTLWDEKYYWFTYKDIFRITGNFMYDYKNYLKKSKKQKSKVWKDSQIISEICLWVNILWINFKNENIIFISSDYWFIKEIKKLKNDLIYWNINIQEHYSDLSSFFLQNFKKIFSEIKIIKFNIKDYNFENENWEKSKFIEKII